MHHDGSKMADMTIGHALDPTMDPRAVVIDPWIDPRRAASGGCNDSRTRGPG
jgi:hypothetical protein